MNHRRAQIIPLLAIALVILIAFVALTVDVGLAYVRRRQLQNAADFAALAGSHLIATNDGSKTDQDVESVMATIATRNQEPIDFSRKPPLYVDSNLTPVGVVGQGGAIPSAASGVETNLSATQVAYFAPVLQFLGFQPGASAFDVCFPADFPSFMSGLSPLSAPIQDFQANQNYDLWNSQYAKDYNVPSNFKGLLNLNQGSGPYYQAGANCGNVNSCVNTWSATGFDGQLGQGDDVGTINGDHGNNVASGIDQMIASQGLSDANGPYGIIYISLWDSYNTTTGTVHIAGFAAFKVYQSNVKSSSLSGQFVALIEPTSPKGGGAGTTYGPKTCKIVNPSAGVTVIPTSTLVPTPTTLATSTPTPSSSFTTTPIATTTSTPTAAASGTALPTLTSTPTMLATSPATATSTATSLPTSTATATPTTVATVTASPTCWKSNGKCN